MTASQAGLRVLFLVEGFTDIRFVVGLSEICDLSMIVPARAYTESGLAERVAASGARLTVHQVPGGRLEFQLRSLWRLWKASNEVDVILSQELLRGTLNASVVGALRGVPVVATMAISAVEYFRCRRERGLIGTWGALAGEWAIRALMAVNGRLATRCLALGPYLCQVASAVSPRTEMGYYYGVDTSVYAPVTSGERLGLRRRLGLPEHVFLVLFASRVSHEKDPESVLQAVARTRAAGLDAVVLNLGGGYREFLDLARDSGLAEPEAWVLGRPAAHPTRELADYYRTADVLVQSSLAEGFGLAPLEALACETPVVATDVGGMALHLRPFATLTPRRNAEAMAGAILAVARNPDAARAHAALGRDYVCRRWSRDRAFAELRRALTEVSGRQRVSARAEAA